MARTVLWNRVLLDEFIDLKNDLHRILTRMEQQKGMR